MVQFLFAFDSNLKPIVGQQITLSGTGTTAINDRIDLLIARAAAGDADLIVKYTQSGEKRGAHRLSGGNFETDKTSESTLTDIQLRNLALTTGQEITYTAVPVGAGIRMGIDRDEDAILDADDNCPSFTNPGQEDDDSDGIGNACEPPDTDGDGLTDAFEASIGTNPLLTDTDSDGLSDYAEVNFDGDDTAYTPGLDTDPLVGDTDGDGLLDGADPSPLVGGVAGDVAPVSAPDGIVNVADYLVAMRIVLGGIVPTATQLAIGDLYPVGSPDGVINVSDLILLNKLILP